MNLYDPSLAVQTYGQGLQQANADQMALAQAPTPAQIFLDRLRQSKQDQLQRDQFDWQKQYQGRMLQNTAERNAAWAENNKLKNQIGLYNADTKRQLGEAANELRQQANAIRSAHYGNVDPARVQALQAQANLMGSKADEIDSLLASPAGSDENYLQLLNDAKRYSLTHPWQLQSSGMFGGSNADTSALVRLLTGGMQVESAQRQQNLGSPGGKIGSVQGNMPPQIDPVQFITENLPRFKKLLGQGGAPPAGAGQRDKKGGAAGGDWSAGLTPMPKIDIDFYQNGGHLNDGTKTANGYTIVKGPDGKWYYRKTEG